MPKKLAVVMAVLFTLICGTALVAAPKAASQRECLVLADIALVSSAIAKHGGDRAVVEKAMPEVYDLPTERTLELMRLTVALSFRESADPTALMHKIFGVCVEHEGALDSILGVGT